MSSPISPGQELNRRMVQIGYPDAMGGLLGTALDKAIVKDPALARNLMDMFSSIGPSQLDRNLQRGRLVDPGYSRAPKEVFQDSRNKYGARYYEREAIHTYSIGKDASAVTIGGKPVDIGQSTTPADFEKRLLTDADFRAGIEKQLGGRIVLDGSADGKIRVAKRGSYPETRHPHSSRALKNLMERLGKLLNRDARTEPRAVPILPEPVGRDHRSEPALMPSPIVRDHRSEGPVMYSSPVVRDHRADAGVVVRDHRGESSPVIRDHRTGAPPVRSNPVLENLDNYVRVSNPEVYSAPASNGADLSGILKDPNLSFEEKLALFMFAFLEKKQKNLEQKMEELDKDSKKGGSALGTLAKVGGAVAGAVTGGPAGAVTGAQVGSEVANIVDGGGKGEGEDKSNQIAMMKLNNEMQEMNQMFSLVDNMLKSMNDVVKQGPLAAIRG